MADKISCDNKNYNFYSELNEFIKTITTTKYPWDKFTLFVDIERYAKKNIKTIKSSNDYKNIINVINQNIDKIRDITLNKKLNHQEYDRIINLFMDIDDNLYLKEKKFAIDKIKINRTKYYYYFLNVARYGSEKDYDITEFEELLIDRYIEKNQGDKKLELKSLPYTVFKFLKQVKKINRRKILKELYMNGISEYFVKQYITHFPELSDLSALI